MEDEQAREEEIVALKAIYEDAVAEVGKNVLIWDIQVEVEKAIKIEWEGEEIGRVRNLPPIRMIVGMPKDYPSKSLPRVRIEAEWMEGEEKEIVKRMEGVEVGDVVIFEWGSMVEEFIREKVENGIWKVKKRGWGVWMVEWGEKREKEDIEKGFYKCGACLEIRNGSECTMLKCGHVGCTECFKEYWKCCIEDGRVTNVGCMECGERVVSGIVRNICGEELWDKYERFVLGRELNGERFCVRGCGGIAYINDGMGRCAYCEFVFCIQCEKGWHGIEECKDGKIWFGNQRLEWEEVLKRFQEGEDVKDKVKIQVWEKLQTWKTVNEMNARKCPKCNMVIVKNGGCMHMKCLCGCHWCWICEKDIEEEVDHYAPGKCRLYEEDDRQLVHEDVWEWVMFQDQ